MTPEQRGRGRLVGLLLLVLLLIAAGASSVDLALEVIR